MVLRSLAVVLLLLPLVACREPAAGPDPAPPGVREAAPEAAAEAVPASTRSPRRERPLPAFSGWTLGGKRFEVSSLIGKRAVLFFFNPELPDAGLVAGAFERVAALGPEFNFEVIGIGVGSDHDTLQAFAKAQDLHFPVVDDSTAEISRKLLLRAPLAMIGVDAEGYVIFGTERFATQAPEAGGIVENQIRDALRLPEVGDAGADALAEHPAAPLFEAAVLDGDEPFSLVAQRGKPVVLIFFLHTCPHCHEALAFFKEQLAALPEATRPVLVGVEVTGRTHAVRAALVEHDLGFFPVLFDDDGSITAAYGVFGGVPDTFLIDAEGRIVARVKGWREDKDPPLLRMRLARLAGAAVPMLLRTTGYSGNEACGICHELERETWQITSHARAYDTLVVHGASGKDECVSCHVIGFDEPGGFVSALQTAELENVGCESCHGRGGPHLSPGFIQEANYAPACLQCHDTKHSLGFEYAKFLPRVSHAANAYITRLPLAEKQKLLAERGAVREDLLPSTAPVVGSAACRSCHETEFATWAASPHAKALASLERKEEADNASCLQCHTTAFGKTGGFPRDAAPADHADLARVGCESCHGPGGDHVAESAEKFGTILSLGDKCDSCVILQICGGCHDDANDPGFEFEVEAKIESQRHGTTEAGTGRPLGRGATLHPTIPRTTGPDLVAQAVALFAAE